LCISELGIVVPHTISGEIPQRVEKIGSTDDEARENLLDNWCILMADLSI